MPTRRSRARRVVLRASLAVLALAAAGPALANNGIQLTAQSAKSVGRGGAEAAVGDDVMTSISNPATIGLIEDMRVDGMIGIFLERVRSTDRFKDEVDTNVIPVPSGGVAWDPFRIPATDDAPALSSDWRFGVTLWEPVSLMVSLSPTVSYRVADNFWIGLQVEPIYTDLNLTIQAHSGGGPVDPSAPPDFTPQGKIYVHYRPDGTAVDPPEPFDAGTGTQVSWGEVFTLANNTSGPAPTAPPPITKIDLKSVQGFGIGGQLGFLWQPLPEVAIGGSYRTPAVIFHPRGKASINLDEAVEAIKANPTIGTLLTAAFETYLPARGLAGYKQDYDADATNVYLPEVFTIGGAWTPLPGWLIAADFRFIHWNGATSKIVLHGSKGNNPDFNEIAGGTTIDYTVVINWTDSWTVAVGTAYQVNEHITLRAGFNHGKNPVSKQFLGGNSLGTEDHATVGAGYAWTHWEIDLAYMYGLPTTVKDYGGQSASTSEQHWLFLGVGYRF